jgi:hypothetical protein
MTGYIIFRVIIALVSGWILYMLDRAFGTGLYRWWYGMTHEHPMPAGEARGFIHGRTTRSRVFWATVLSSLLTLVAVMDGSYNALLELLLWLVSIPVAVAAFIIGPRFHSVWGRRETVYTAVDKWERGEIDLTDQMKIKGSEIAAGVRQTVTETVDHVSQALPKRAESKPAAAPPPEPVASEPEVDPQERVNRFIKRT